MTNGQTDINANPNGTAFCISGVHNWSLVPKTGDQFYGGILDGGNATNYAFQGSAANVVLSGLEIRNYRPANQQGAIAAVGTGWTLDHLQVHDNGSSAGGAGSTGGHAWRFLGGRYYNNRQEGIAGGVSGAGEAQNTMLDGVEIDHNNFTNDAYTTANINCDFEAGGFKWVGSGNTITNSSVHDNACRGLWADITATNSTVTNNRVYNNWADGIMIEISSGATISGNTVSGNGFKEFNAGAGTCAWMYGAGIFISTSSHVEVSGNNLMGNCKGITGAQQNRGAQYPVLEYLNVHDNIVSGPGISGASADDGTNLATRHITFTNNSFVNGATFCNLSC